MSDLIEFKPYHLPKHSLTAFIQTAGLRFGSRSLVSLALLPHKDRRLRINRCNRQTSPRCHGHIDHL